MNRQQRRHSGKPRGMSYADQLARERTLREAAQLAASDMTVQVKADTQVQRAMWMMCVAMNDAFGIGPERFNRFAECLQSRAEWHEKNKRETDEEYADEKLRQEAQRCSGIEIEYLYEAELRASKKRHENDKVTRFEQFRFYKPQKMAEILCDWIDCQKCPGCELCSCKDGKANGLVKWFEQEVDKNA